MGVLEQTYNLAMEKPLQVLDIFNEFFGEDRVDMQGFPILADVSSVLSESTSLNQLKTFITNRYRGFILVHFPHVRISNEYDKFTDINHLYAKVSIDIDGKILGKFQLNRSEYTVLHFTNDYMHSHISSIPVRNFMDFQTPCTGSGPINNTICSLARDFDADLWRLFCLELDRFTQVESISGTPYHRLEGLVAGGRGNGRVVYNSIRINEELNKYVLGDAISAPQLAQFIKCVIDSKILKFSYQEGGYCLAMSPTEYYIKISNLFIKWYNREYKRGNTSYNLDGLIGLNILGRYKFVNGAIVQESRYNRDYHPYIGSLVCTFKGQPVRLTISDAVESTEENDVLIINQDIGEYIFTKLFNVINFRYGNKREQGTEPCKKVCYI